MVLALGMVLILSVFGTPKRFDFNLDWNVQPCVLDDLGRVTFPSIAGIVTDNGVDPLDYANGMSNPLFSSSFFSSSDFLKNEFEYSANSNLFLKKLFWNWSSRTIFYEEKED